MTNPVPFVPVPRVALAYVLAVLVLKGSGLIGPKNIQTSLYLSFKQEAFSFERIRLKIYAHSNSTYSTYVRTRDLGLCQYNVGGDNERTLLASEFTSTGIYLTIPPTMVALPGTKFHFGHATSASISLSVCVDRRTLQYVRATIFRTAKATTMWLLPKGAFLPWKTCMNHKVQNVQSILPPGKSCAGDTTAVLCK